MARSFATQLDRQVARVRRRMFLQTLLTALAWSWLVSLACAVGWFLAEPYWRPDAAAWLRWAIAGGFAGAGTVFAVVLTALRAPSRTAAALALDERFQLKERTTTALTLSEAELASPAGQALVADVNTRLMPLRVRDRFPVRLSRWAALVPVAVLALVLLAFFYKPALNQAQAGTSEPLADSPVAKSKIEKALRPLQRKQAQKIGERPKSEELQRLEAELDRLAQKPHDTKEQARELVKDITNAEDEVRKREKQLADRVDALKEQMKQAERLSKQEKKDGPAKKLDKALDQAEFKKAKEEADRLGKQLQADEEVARLRKKMQDDKLTDEQKKEIKDQLEKLKDQELSREQKEQMRQQLQDMKDKLERLTRSDEAKERLRELQRQGAMSKEELDRELDQLDKNMDKLDPQTLKDLQELAQKLGECQKCMKEGKQDEAAQKLAEAAEKLANLDPNGENKDLQQQLQQLQAARKAVCQALDPKPVPGAGQRPESKDGETASKEEWAHSQMDKGRLQVIDHVPGDGFKGPRKPAEMTEEIRRASQEEPEAIDRQRLPRSASDMARGYFEKLRGPERNDKKADKP
ncbi:MAG TPA: hypothetical protein VH643_19640 [Gemmataceae bacterium]|jgi:hypothetical protein